MYLDEASRNLEDWERRHNDTQDHTLRLTPDQDDVVAHQPAGSTPGPVERAAKLMGV
jgi:hypothetical protein